MEFCVSVCVFLILLFYFMTVVTSSVRQGTALPAGKRLQARFLFDVAYVHR